MRCDDGPAARLIEWKICRRVLLILYRRKVARPDRVTAVATLEPVAVD